MHIRMGRLAGLAAVATAVAATAMFSGAALAGATPKAPQAYHPPAIKHVWVIQMENESYGETFGNTSGYPYLGKTLPSMGALLKDYYSIGHHSLDDYIAEISGQSPDSVTQNDCPDWTAFPSKATVLGPYHQVVGDACVYPSSVQTIGNQLSARGLSWAAYMQDMGNNPGRDRTTKTSQGPACGHPKIGTPDATEKATAADQYATRHEGFMYFESVIGNQAYCDAHILSFQPLLKDLSKASTTPSFSWITPNLCNDGHDSPCANGQPGGLVDVNVDAFGRSGIPFKINQCSMKAYPAQFDTQTAIVAATEVARDAAGAIVERLGGRPADPSSIAAAVRSVGSLSGAA